MFNKELIISGFLGVGSISLSLSQINDFIGIVVGILTCVYFVKKITKKEK